MIEYIIIVFLCVVIFMLIDINEKIGNIEPKKEQRETIEPDLLKIINKLLNERSNKNV